MFSLQSKYTLTNKNKQKTKQNKTTQGKTENQYKQRKINRQ